MARHGGRRSAARKTPRVAGHRKQGRRPPVRGNWACALSETLALLSAAYVVFGMLVTVYLVAAILHPPRRASVRLPPPSSGSVPSQESPPDVVPSEDPSAAQGVTFFLSPSTVKDGWMQVRGNRDLTVVGSAIGAAQVEFLLAPTGTEAVGAERLLQAALVDPDGSFVMTVRMAPGTIGRVRVQARTSTGSTFTSETVDLLAE